MSGLTVEDQLQIRQLLYRYALAADTRDVVLLKSCFAPGIKLTGPGFELSKDVAEAVIAGLEARYLWTQHNVFNPLYQVQGGEASGVVNCIATHVDKSEGGFNKLDWYLRYHDQLLKQSGEWRLSERRLEVFYQSVTPVMPLSS